MSSSSSQPPRTDSSAIPSSIPRLPTTRCATCGARDGPKKSRNLVVCIDGTTNKFGRNNTNVIKLFEAVDDNKPEDREQRAYYSSGIGTRPKALNAWKRMKNALADKLNTVIAWNTKENVKDAYTWLAGNYQKGDQIYLFGFSRGAYQVRVLAWMIYEVGMIKHPTEKLIGTAYDHFESVLSLERNASDIARQFKMTFSWSEARVHFIGVWDTVSSVGFCRGNVSLSASLAAAHACHIRHALALDEFRVKFMPEYFFEVNSPGHQSFAKDTQSNSRSAEPSKKNDLQRGANEVGIPIMNAAISERARDSGIAFGSWERIDLQAQRNTIPCGRSSNGQHTDQRIHNIKEVWFAGSHSDVGGMNRPRKRFHAGNVSLMWMRQEASTAGLVLKPRDVLWTAEDLNFGTTNSMSLPWRLAEILPVKHQVSFSGVGKNAWRLHLSEPRRIIPGQKIHASIQVANMYTPKATFGNGFGNPLTSSHFMPSKEDDIWEKGLIDHTAYVALFDYLTGQGVASDHLHKLLFMTRFTNGHSPFKEVPDLRKTLSDLIDKESGLTRLVAIIAYVEALDSLGLNETIPEEVRKAFEKAKVSLEDSMKSNQAADWSRAVALVQPLVKHDDLRDSILTTEIIKAFLQLLNKDTVVRGMHFADLMDALSSLVEHYPNLESITDWLVRTEDRLSSMLHTNNLHHLSAVLRVAIALAKKEPHCCPNVVSKLQELAKTRKKAFRTLAIQALSEILHAEHPQEQHQPSNTASLGSDQKFLQSLLDDADRRHTQARTAATLSLLRLCKDDDDIRNNPSRRKQLLDVFLRQLQFRDSALLAAYALMKCHSHEAFSKPICGDRDFVGYIVNMIKLDYFDEAIGMTEGFDIFRGLLKCDELKAGILQYDITTILKSKLGSGKQEEMRTGLIYLDIFRGYSDVGDLLTRELVRQGMSCLSADEWRSQRAGASILCSLARTWFGVEALKEFIPRVVDMILPTHGLNNQRIASDPHRSRSKPPASLLGPAFALCVLAENKVLRGEIAKLDQYKRLKHLYLFEDLLGAKDTQIWRIATPTRDDVLDTISQMIRTVDSANDPTNSHFILPRIWHLHRIISPVSDCVLKAIVIPPIATGVTISVLAAGTITLGLTLISRTVSEFVRRHWYLRRQLQDIHNLRQSGSILPPQIVQRFPDATMGDILSEPWQHIEQTELDHDP